jgi:hypothetical protein
MVLVVEESGEKSSVEKPMIKLRSNGQKST